jgi:hypothetical protein
MTRIQYTVRGVPPDVDGELRSEARATGKTLNTVVLETLEHAKRPANPSIRNDLDWFIGSASSDADDSDAAHEWLDALPTEPE